MPKADLFDSRCIERHIRQGLVNRHSVKEHLDSLADVSSKGITLGELEDQRSQEANNAQAPAAAASEAPSPTQGGEAQPAPGTTVGTGFGGFQP